MKAILKEFEAFVMKGNVIDLAVGVLIGTAFGEVVKKFTEGIINPLLGAIGGTPQIGLQIWVLNVGLVLSALLGFLITAAVMFFIFVKPMNKLKALTMKKAETSNEPALVPEDVKLLMEIRDLLRSQNGIPTTKKDVPLTEGV